MPRYGYDYTFGRAPRRSRADLSWGRESFGGYDRPFRTRGLHYGVDYGRLLAGGHSFVGSSRSPWGAGGPGGHAGAHGAGFRGPRVTPPDNRGGLGGYWGMGERGGARDRGRY